MKYLLDTDHLAVWERMQGSQFAILMSHMSQVELDDICVSVVSLHEQSLGCNSYISRAKNRVDLVRGYRMFHRTLDLFRRANVIGFGEDAALEFDSLRAAKIRVSTMDLRLAATAISQDLILVTRNVVDFARVPGLMFENWLD